MKWRFFLTFFKYSSIFFPPRNFVFKFYCYIYICSFKCRWLLAMSNWWWMVLGFLFWVHLRLRLQFSNQNLIESCQFNFAKSLSEKPIMFFFSFPLWMWQSKFAKKKKKGKKKDFHRHLECTWPVLLRHYCKAVNNSFNLKKLFLNSFKNLKKFE
jgi:hypothetical protein